MLLLDVDGVLQFRRPEFVAAIERDYQWRHGYLAFQREVLHDYELLDLIARVAVERIYLATNQEAIRAAHIAVLYADRPWLTGMLFSHAIGHAKPNRSFFDEGLARIGRQPQECLFVDDKQANIEGAGRAGLPGVHFRDNRQLASDLMAYGLLPRRESIDRIRRTPKSSIVEFGTTEP